jgi:hypothetical protein
VVAEKAKLQSTQDTGAKRQGGRRNNRSSGPQAAQASGRRDAAPAEAPLAETPAAPEPVAETVAAAVQVGQAMAAAPVLPPPFAAPPLPPGAKAPLHLAQVALEAGLRLQQETVTFATAQAARNWRAGQALARCRSLPAAMAVQRELIEQSLADGTAWARAVSRVAASLGAAWHRPGGR